MNKKTKKVLPEIPKELEVEVFMSGPREEPVPKLGHLSLELGREDLNKLRDKINEVIDYLNSV